MPKSLLIFYKDADGSVPVRDWLSDLKGRNDKGFVRCVARLKLLAAEGHDLRRPAADILRNGIYELRAKSGAIKYRLLHFFHGRDVTVLDHAFVKKGAAVPDADMNGLLEGEQHLRRIPRPIPFKENWIMTKTKDAMKMVDSMLSGDKQLKKAVEEATVNAQVAQLIYDVRTKSGLTQKQLAQRIGTKQSVIARLEDADYEGHSLFMLQRIAGALDQNLVINLLPKKKAA